MAIESATQDTFLSCRELLNRYAAQCNHAEQALRQQATGVSEPYQEVLNKIASHEHDIVSTLKNYTQRGPDAVLNTRIQYKEPTRPNRNVRSPGLSIQQATDINREIVAALTDQAEKTVPERVREALNTLAAEVDGINRQISMDRVTIRDI